MQMTPQLSINNALWIQSDFFAFEEVKVFVIQCFTDCGSGV